MYLIRSPFIFKWIYPQLVWKINTKEKVIYLTFDDGPHPLVTPFVLNILKNYNAKASFFCIGKNVAAYPDVYDEIIKQGHTVGNHTHNHLNGWKTDDETYIENICTAEKYIKSKLFRPPYGRIKKSQVAKVKSKKLKLKIIMWSILSGDFDTKISPETCTANILKNTKSGDIIVFHDSEKAFDRLKIALPATLAHFTKQGVVFKALDEASIK